MSQDLDAWLDELGVIKPPRPAQHAPVAPTRKADAFRHFEGDH